MNARQRAFVEHYVATHNATEAAIKAGYSERRARQTGHDLVTKRDIAAAIADREAHLADEIGITKQRLLLAQWEVFEKALAGAPLVHEGEPVTYTDPDTGERRLVFKWSPSGANKALETLMKHRGMLTDRTEVEHTGTVYTLDIGDLDGDQGEGQD